MGELSLCVIAICTVAISNLLQISISAIPVLEASLTLSLL